jgi:phosphoserine phosphatase
VADPAPDLTASRLRLPDRLAATLVLVRHGESTWIAEGRFQGRLDPPLSELGQRQAALVGAQLADRDAAPALPIPAGPPVAVWHSPLSRAASTAAAIASAQPVTTRLVADERLTEIAQGEWEGLPHAEVSSRWPAELAGWRRAPTRNHAPGGESLAEAGARVGSALTSILHTLADEARPLATPDATRAADVASVGRDPVPGYPSALPAGAPPEPWGAMVAHDGIFRLALMSLLGVPRERFWSFPFNLAAITVVAINDRVAVLRAHNLGAHLAPLGAGQMAAEEARGERRGAL